MFLAGHRDGIVGSRPLSKENNLWKITKPERTGRRYQYPLFSFLFVVRKFRFFLWIAFFGEWSFCVQKAMERGGLMEKMEKIQTDKKEVQRERKKPEQTEQTEQTKQAAVCIGQNEQKEVKYGRYRVTSTFAGTENLTDLLECYIDRVGSLRYGA